MMFFSLIYQALTLGSRVSRMKKNVDVEYLDVARYVAEDSWTITLDWWGTIVFVSQDHPVRIKMTFGAIDYAFHRDWDMPELRARNNKWVVYQALRKLCAKYDIDTLGNMNVDKHVANRRPTVIKTVGENHE